MERKRLEAALREVLKGFRALALSLCGPERRLTKERALFRSLPKRPLQSFANTARLICSAFHTLTASTRRYLRSHFCPGPLFRPTPASREHYKVAANPALCSSHNPLRR